MEWMDRFVIKMVDFDSISRSETKDCKNSILQLFHPTLNSKRKCIQPTPKQTAAACLFEFSKLLSFQGSQKNDNNKCDLNCGDCGDPPLPRGKNIFV